MMEGVVPRRRDCLGESRDLEGGRSISPKRGGGGRRARGSGGTGRDEVAEFTFLRYRWIRDDGVGCEYGHAKGQRGLFLYTRGVGDANEREVGGAYNGRRGDGDKTTFEHPESGRHKYAKTSRRPGQEGGDAPCLIKTMRVFWGEWEREQRSH